MKDKKTITALKFSLHALLLTPLAAWGMLAPRPPSPRSSNWKLVNTSSYLAGPVNSVQFNPSGTLITASSDYGEICLLETEKLTVQKRLDDQSGPLKKAQFIPQGNKVAYIAENTIIKFWNPTDNNGLQELKVFDDTNTGTEKILSLAFSPDGKELITASDDSKIRIITRESGKVEATLARHTKAVNTAQFSPDKKYIISASQDTTFRIWDATTKETLKATQAQQGNLSCALFSPDSSNIATAGADGTIKIWKLIENPKLKPILLTELKQTLAGHKGTVNTLSFNHDGTLLLSGGDDKTIKLWQPETGTLVKTLEGHAGKVQSASFDQDGKRIVSGSEDKTVKIWAIETLQDTKLPTPTPTAPKSPSSVKKSLEALQKALESRQQQGEKLTEDELKKLEKLAGVSTATSILAPSLKKKPLTIPAKQKITKVKKEKDQLSPRTSLKEEFLSEY